MQNSANQFLFLLDTHYMKEKAFLLGEGKHLAPRHNKIMLKDAANFKVSSLKEINTFMMKY